MIITRRDFLKTGASVVAVGAGVPAFLGQVAQARAAENDKSTANRVLVLIELNGGNDGLNTVIPIDDPAYAAARPTIAIGKEAALGLDKGVALHPSMTAMQELFKSGRLAVIQGAGYPNANRSHFHSMDIWHHGDPEGRATNGWLGRYYERTEQPPKSPVSVVYFGQKRPEAFRAAKAPAISVNAIDDFYPSDAKRPESAAVNKLYQRKDAAGDSAEMMPNDAMHAPADTKPGADDPTVSIQNTGQDIVRGTEIIKGVIAKPRTPKVSYPNGQLGASMAVFSQMIVQNTGTKLFFTNIGGFDTHARQAEGHSRLLGQVSGSIGAFLDDLKAEGRDKEVLVMVFSEFGRRVKENGSAGTDHGAASAMFFAGGAVKGGLYGKYPSLTDLGDGDLKYTTDFRDCYATVLEKWLATDPARVLAGKPGRVDFL